MFPRIAFVLLLLLAGLTMLLAGCLGAPLWPGTPLPPTETSTLPPPTGTPTTTPVWFPPTATFTPLPAITYAVTPTLDMSPSYGALVLEDDFHKTELWTTGRTPAGSVAQGVSELTLAVSQPRAYLFSLRQETALGDFYLEINASPSICRDGDEYGLLVRVSSLQDFLRFGLTCRGEARLDRVVNGDASAPQPPAFYGAIPPGAPSTSRLGVWARGKELRFYANGQYLFSVRDPGLLKGSLGVYARAAGDNPMTVNFSSLTIYNVR